MGCWNETCGLTQMPIEGGDPIRMFLLVRNKQSYVGSGIVYYSTDLWKPFGIPLKGTYDEYGCIENIQEDILSDFLLESLKEMIIEVPNRMGEEFKKDSLNWKTAINFLTDEGLKVVDPFSHKQVTTDLDEAFDLIMKAYENIPKDQWSPELSKMAKEKKNAVKEKTEVTEMYHMMVHEDVYQAIVNHNVKVDRWSGVENLRARLETDAVVFIKQTRENFERERNLSEIDKLATKWGRKAFNMEMLHDNYFVSSVNFLSGNNGSGKYIKKYVKKIENKIEAGALDDDLEIQQIKNQLIGFIQFSRAMSFLRKQWMPQCGKGGQDAEYGLHQFLGQVIVDFSTKKIKQWDEDFGEDIDESDHDTDETT